MSTNEYTISDVFQFAEDIQHNQVDGNGFLVSQDVTALSTNVALDETIRILAEKVFNDNWFNNARNQNINRNDLVELLSAATEDQIFLDQFNGMGWSLGPFMASAFMCPIEEELACENKLPSFYKRCVDDFSWP